MGERTIETRAIISAEDKTGTAFSSVLQKLARMESAARAASARLGSVDRASLVSRKAELAVQKEMLKVQKEQLQTSGGGTHDRAGREMAKAIIGGYIAHQTAHFAHQSLETYREFDNQRRYAKAVMQISDEDQAPLITQAVHGGGSSKYNDIQWLDAQRELAARGLNVRQVMAIVEVASKLGQAMDKSLPEASRALEGGMFGFGKDTSTYEKALENAKRTADLQVKASKISGMGYDDVVQAYKYGAAPFRMAGLSEEQLLAFAAVGKKANMGGDEMGVAARALAANLLKPTAGARTAMLANGVDYSKYQRLGPQPMNVEPFAQSIASSYGVALSEKAKSSLQKVFDDQDVVKDAAKFMPAIMKVLSSELGGDDAKAKKSIAGEARRFRDASMNGVDAQALFNALIPAIAKNPALANAVFGAKQGARIRTAIGDPEVFDKKLDELKNHSQGYASEISDQRMAGFDGAVSRFEGAVKNLESALPRAFDSNGKGGLLTGAADVAGRFTQALAEAPPQLQRLAAEAGAAAAVFAGLKGAEALLGGFGLNRSAAMLTEAAHALMGAARKETLSGAGGSGGGDTPKKSVLSRIHKVMKNAAIVGTVVDVLDETSDWLEESTKETGVHNDGRPYVKYRGPGMGGNPGARTLRPAPSNPFGALPDKSTFAPKPRDVDVKVSPVEPLKITVEVVPGSELLAVKDAMRQLKAQLRAKADTAPGGLGETQTHQ